MQTQSAARDADADCVKMWGEFSKSRSLEARNDLVMHYMGLAKRIALHMAPSYRKHVEFDDLLSSGLIGLMDAIDRFDPGKDVKFETYATLRIKGEIIDQIRRQDWAPISLRQKIKRIEEGYGALESNLGRVPSEQEVSDYLGIGVEDVKKTLDESHTFNLVALDELLADRIKSDHMLASDRDNPEISYEDKELRRIMAEMIDTLPERERIVISMYYTDELTLKEIGGVLGVSESRVSQIHSKALLALRTKMKKAIEI